MRLIWAFSVYKTTTAPQCVWAVMRTKGRAWDYEGERQWRPCPWLNNRTSVVESGKLVEGCTHDQLCGRRWHCLYCRPASGATASVPGCCNHSIGCSDLVLDLLFTRMGVFTIIVGDSSVATYPYIFLCECWVQTKAVFTCVGSISGFTPIWWFASIMKQYLSKRASHVNS